MLTWILFLWLPTTIILCTTCAVVAYYLGKSDGMDEEANRHYFLRKRSLEDYGL